MLIVVVLVVGATQAWSWWQTRGLAQQIQQLAKPGDIVMYSSDTCIYCVKAAAWFAAHHIPWQECNIDKTPLCQSQFQARGAPGTPLFKLANQWRLGFDPAWMAKTLADQG